ncbi:alpha-galactosidase [Cellulomonas fimi]|uniref:alpha-galactosidase n=1 Tax=Cellulomonas fimi TaxID=1708 RepID=A0A7Y0LYG6_CELFI|nr:alpha-galactosidase [Cellulomonas fimi]NMR20259.1 alpha-galactosidase [Cellulomonas fimi]
MLIHLRAAGTSVVLDARGTAVPAVTHWGADLGPLDDDALGRLVAARVPPVPPSALDVPFRLSLLPTLDDGWSGRPGISGFVTAPAGEPGDARSPLPMLALEDVATTPSSARFRHVADGCLWVTTDVELTPQGVLRVRHTWANEGERLVEVGSLDAVLPVPERAAEVLDLSGTWSHERRPQRHQVVDGVWSRETRHGRPGHDHPYLVVVGTPGFGFRSGEVWAAHVAWSGDTRHWVERSPLGATVLAGGELLHPGEMVLRPGDSWTTPWLVAVWSDAGLDGLSARLHRWVRATSPVPGPRPVTLNTWEAVYFDHDLPRLVALAEEAAAVGVERFVLDDGWFQGRTDDRRALGDWWVDDTRWPDGLHPLADVVTGLGMELGLWVEPEMVSPDSRTAREHPDWLLTRRGTWRNQHVLDLSVPAAAAHVLGSIDALLAEYPIGYLKWDHNRDLLVPAAHRQTTALYALLDELRRRHPTVEIESCASGGARVDLGILERVDRFWTSDDNDPLERQAIQRWSTLLVPPEYLGSHVGPSPAHTTGRVTDLGFRLVTSLFLSAGLEWDLTRASVEERRHVAAWIAGYRGLRGLLHSGSMVRVDASDPAVELHGVVAADRREAVFAQVALSSPRSALPAPMRFPGLDAEQEYAVRVLPIGDPPRVLHAAPPPWVERDDVVLPGRLLTEAGLPAPLLLPGQALVVHLRAAG